MWQGRVKLLISNTTRVVLSHIFTAIPMLFHVNTILADFCGCFHVRDVQIVLLQNIYYTNWCYTVMQTPANNLQLQPFHWYCCYGDFCMRKNIELM